MSYIDSYAHELVGYFAGRPLYHPLENIPGNPDDIHEFACSPSQLVIGGGGGEHSGLIITKPESAVATFIDTSDEFDLDDDTSSDLIEFRYNDHMLHFAGWDSREHYDFYLACCSNALSHPFKPDSGLSFEEWIGCSVGEFIFFSMPEITPNLIAKYAPLRSGKPFPHYNNILLPPPGVETFANRGNAFTSKRNQNNKK